MSLYNSKAQGVGTFVFPAQVACLLEGIRVVLETQCRVLALSPLHPLTLTLHWWTNERTSALCGAWEWTAAAAAAAVVMATQPAVDLDQVLSQSQSASHWLTFADVHYKLLVIHLV